MQRAPMGLRLTGVNTGRQPPPEFVRARVHEIVWRSPKLATVTLEGEGLGALVPPKPAGSVRMLLPRIRATDALEIPEWDGNAFRYADGTSPPIRTLTPIDVGRPDALAVGIIDHDAGSDDDGRSRLATWLHEVTVGDEVAVSGPGAGSSIDTGVAHHVVFGDESAIPAIEQVLEVIADAADDGVGARAVEVAIEIATPEARLDIDPASAIARSATSFTWCERTGEPGDATLAWLRERELSDGTRVWFAGEARTAQAVRTLCAERGVTRAQMHVRGYWKHGRAGGHGVD